MTRSIAPSLSRQSLFGRIAASIFLFGLTWLVFAETSHHDFVNYDDGVYVTQNAQVRGGLTFPGLAWAFTQPHARNWHPLTTVSHMLDCQFFGLAPGGHHFVNVLLHAIAVVLLFLFLNRVAGVIWSSAFIAALFAIHPLRVESVAWIAERKDVLGGVFFMLTLSAYARYARQPSVARYITMSILFACGLMSKAMLVTVPVILLLLDYWPLNRMVDLASFRRMLWEKLPLFTMSILAGVVTFLIQQHSFGAIASLPLRWRIDNAIVSCVTYLWQTIWPTNLAVFYPHPENHLSLWQVALAALFLIFITALVIAYRKRRPYLIVGWLLYLSMLAPVIGIVQVGLQGHADRYTYLPQIGLFIAITLLIVDLAGALRYRRQIFAATAAFVLIALSACARKQSSFWRNTETLWSRALAVTQDNDVAHTNLGMFLMERGQLDDAISHFETALQIRSGDAHAHYDLSRAIIHSDLGDASVRKGSPSDAIAHYRTAIEFEPAYADAHYNLGTVLSQCGDLTGAIAEWETTLSIQPEDVEAHTSIANALLRKNDLREALAQYERAVAAPVPSMFALNNLAWILSTCPNSSVRNGARAVDLAQRAVRLSQENVPTFIRTLAAAQAENGRFDEAIASAHRAATLAGNEDVDLVRQIEKDVDLYRSRVPFRDSSLPDVR
ncbi:MAG: tetratricopeptide repeat protein [Spartobacteria bacterium]